MIRVPSPYAPPRWLRNPHVQSVLGSSPMRRRRGVRVLAASGAITAQHVVDGGDGVRLHGLHSTLPNRSARGLALLMHGWEGSADSSYMRLTATALLQRGFDVFRLNFRDHGGSHHLNADLFHSNRIDEVVHAALDIHRRFLPGGSDSGAPMVAAGYSLGGNFALRVAARASMAGLPLVRAAAVCPVLDPAQTMLQMERGFPLYMLYFERKWRDSLAQKRKLFPQQHDFDDATLKLRMRDLTDWMVQRHTDFGTLDDYFDGYSIAGDRMACLDVPVALLMSDDDPVIPIADFRDVQLPDSATLETARWGGHCGFLQNARLESYADGWVADRLAAALPDAR